VVIGPEPSPALGVADNVIVATVSELGRRAQENDSGTDHGAAGVHLMIH